MTVCLGLMTGTIERKLTNSIFSSTVEMEKIVVVCGKVSLRLGKVRLGSADTLYR